MRALFVLSLQQMLGGKKIWILGLFLCLPILLLLLVLVSGGFDIPEDVEFDLEGLRIGIHGHDTLATGDPYGLGPAPKSFGWGAVFVVRVREIDRYYENAVKEGVEIVDRDLRSSDTRFFVVKEPSGYLFEITEDDSAGV